ncbi:NADP-dependent malic enzyme [Luteibaculum oceani]|uniref:NADP-dependent malic enzyme n=1 Tax=Luteibaculum oceani TaxID=1294296 RepID=A0A5C6VPF4_9FLAO|nr:NADP-dependent malic enzyme [Luteibaculum oceani]TXC85058.1 NADP-dependent malic enzyme [Luteibaculum oceani]
MAKSKRQEALDYHEKGKPGKIEVVPTKPYQTQRDLSLAYSPGVAEPCKVIAEDTDKVYNYTGKGNLVAVISNGTAVLGLGNIGPEASKPVMEGKGLLFKVFSDIDVFDIEVDATDIDGFVNAVKAIAPTFGGINLEDIKAPEAFEIERRLKAELDIPIMHDDQHGTAIISAAALLNALELAEKKIEEVRVVVSGAGAAAISCGKLYQALGVKQEHIVMFDSKGAITTDRDDLDERKRQFANPNSYEDLADAMKGADVFLGLSIGNIVTPEMLKSMAKNPIVFACANPDPEIPYQTAIETRPDVIMATGRSDHPNQVNNVLGFPYIFRGALDVRATDINEEMKLAAVHALAKLAKKTVPDEVAQAYGLKTLTFGRESIIPKPLDPRLITEVSMAVAKAAMDSGVAKHPITDWKAYEKKLMSRLGLEKRFTRNIFENAKQIKKKRLVFAEADNYYILKAAQQCVEENLAIPILLGKEDEIRSLEQEHHLDLSGCEIMDPRDDSAAELRKDFGKKYFAKRQRKGVTLWEAEKMMRERNYFGSMLVETGKADAFLSGITRSYGEVLRPALRCVGTEPGIKKVAGMYVMLTKDRPYFFADTTVNLNPTVEEIVEITLLTAKTVKKFGIEPRIALLSYSNFGSAPGPDAEKMRAANKILQEEHPDLIVDGEIQANFAINNDLMNEKFPFSKLLDQRTNTLIFPNLSAGNIAYKLMDEMGGAETLGPVLMGMNKPFHVLTLGCSVKEIINMAAIAVLDCETRK